MKLQLTSDQEQGWLELLCEATSTQCAPGINLASVPSSRDHRVFNTTFDLKFATWEIRYIVARHIYLFSLKRTPREGPLYLMEQRDPMQRRNSYFRALGIGEKLLEQIMLAVIELFAKYGGYSISLIHLAGINWHEY